MDTGKTYFVHLPINFVGGSAFLSSAAELDGTYSLEIEFAPIVENRMAYYLWMGTPFFLACVIVCVVCDGACMLLSSDTHSMECPFNAF